MTLKVTDIMVGEVVAIEANVTVRKAMHARAQRSRWTGRAVHDIAKSESL